MTAMLVGCAGLTAGPASPLPSDGDALKGLADNYDATKVNQCLNTPLPAQRTCRDTIVQAMLAAIDLRYANFELGMLDANRYGNFASTVAALGLTTAGALSGGGVGRALAAAAAGVTGARESFNREVLVEHTVLALQASMQARRNEVALRIREGLRRDATDYPLGVALSDLYAYYRGGTLVGALVGVTESASNRAQTSRELLDLTVVPAASLQLPLLPPATSVPVSPPVAPSRPSQPPPATRVLLSARDTGPEARAMFAWVRAAAGNPAETRRRGEAIQSAAVSFGYPAARFNLVLFIDDPTPEVLAMKQKIVTLLSIPMGQ